MAIVQAVGQPANKGEIKAINYLKANLSDEFTIFHNLTFQSPSGRRPECDLVIVGTHAVYVAEVKSFSGKVLAYSQQFVFESGSTRENNLVSNEEKAKMLKGIIVNENLTLNDIWVESIVILSDPNCNIVFKYAQPENVFYLHEAVEFMTYKHTLLNHKQKSIVAQRNEIIQAIHNPSKPLDYNQMLGDYKIIKKISANNLFTTYIAEDKVLKNLYFLKEYTFNIYASENIQVKRKQRILQDAQALFRLGGHPNIARAFTPFFWENGIIVLPVEWIDGISLRSLMDADKDIDFDRVIRIMKQICDGLKYAHENGVIHRNLTPDNILVTKTDEVKIINFDSARVENVDLKTINSQLGRSLQQQYVAPEVWEKASAASYKSDQYSAGIIFFELLTGKTPYDKLDVVFASKKLPELPTEIDANIRHETDEIIQTMCAFSVDNRFPSLEEVIEYIEIIG